MRNADRISAALLLVSSVVFAGAALKNYSYWSEEGPGSAFLPFWLGLVMVVLALMMLVKSLRNPYPGDAWLPRGRGLRTMLVVLGVTVAFVALLNVVGMILDTALFLAALIRYLGRHPWWMTITIALAAAGFNWLVFVRWLRVPMPEGMLWIF